MVELIGDVCHPSDLKLPTKTGSRVVQGGDIFLSGNKIWFHDGTNVEVVTSS